MTASGLSRLVLSRTLALSWGPLRRAIKNCAPHEFPVTKGTPFLCKPFSISVTALCIPSPPDSSVLTSLRCKGCGARLHSDVGVKAGYLPAEKLRMVAEGEAVDAEGRSVVCQRCFYLSHYNQALHASVSGADYLQCLDHVKKKRSLILCMVDVIDFPGSLFPDLNSRIGPGRPVVIVANKIDLLPSSNRRVLDILAGHIREIASKGSLSGCEIPRVHFVSAKLGTGVEELANLIVKNWGSQGDVFLLGCTNVGKSTLFNQMLVLLCGAIPGHLNTSTNMEAPAATISHWPGTTLGLLSFPIMSVGKRFRLLKQKNPSLFAPAQRLEDWEQPKFVSAKERRNVRTGKQLDQPQTMSSVVDEVLEEIGYKRKAKSTRKDHQSTNLSPQNRNWLHDTPGAINKVQFINHLSNKAVQAVLPKKRLVPRTLILKPGQCLSIGKGMVRLDYQQGPPSAYFTVFAAPMLSINTTTVARADEFARRLWEELCSDGSSLDPLLSQELFVQGEGWRHCAADVVLSSAGWVSVTLGEDLEAELVAYTPGGRGVFVRRPSLFPDAVNERGKREKTGNRTRFYVS